MSFVKYERNISYAVKKTKINTKNKYTVLASLSFTAFHEMQCVISLPPPRRETSQRLLQKICREQQYCFIMNAILIMDSIYHQYTA